MAATLEIRRDWAKDIKIRGLEVLLDGQPFANLKFQEVTRAQIEPGPHILRATNTLYSKEETFTVHEGETIVYQVANKMPAAWAWFLMMVSVAPYGVRLARVEVADARTETAVANP